MRPCSEREIVPELLTDSLPVFADKGHCKVNVLEWPLADKSQGCLDHYLGWCLGGLLDGQHPNARLVADKAVHLWVDSSLSNRLVVERLSMVSLRIDISP